MQPVADDASAETIFANGMSAVHKGDKAVAAQMLEKLAAKAGAPATAAPAGPHADHGGAPAAGARDRAARRTRRKRRASCTTSWRR